MKTGTIPNLIKAAECLKVLAHSKRIEILLLLKSYSKSNSSQMLNVNEISELCGISQNVTSEHLRLMHRCGFLEYSKKGRDTYYKISEPHVLKILKCIEEKFN